MLYWQVWIRFKVFMICGTWPLAKLSVASNILSFGLCNVRLYCFTAAQIALSAWTIWIALAGQLRESGQRAVEKYHLNIKCSSLDYNDVCRRWVLSSMLTRSRCCPTAVLWLRRSHQRDTHLSQVSSHVHQRDTLLISGRLVYIRGILPYLREAHMCIKEILSYLR